MKVLASLWFSSPGASPDIEPFDSIAAVITEFHSMRDSWERFGGSPPVGAIYSVGDTDYPLYILEVTPRGAIRKSRA